MNTVGFVIVQNLQSLVIRRGTKRPTHTTAPQQDDARAVVPAESGRSAEINKKHEIEIMDPATDNVGPRSAPQHDGKEFPARLTGMESGTQHSASTAGTTEPSPKHSFQDSSSERSSNDSINPKSDLLRAESPTHSDDAENVAKDLHQDSAISQLDSSGHPSKSLHKCSPEEKRAKYLALQRLASSSSSPGQEIRRGAEGFQSEPSTETLLVGLSNDGYTEGEHGYPPLSSLPDPSPTSHEEDSDTDHIQQEHRAHVLPDGTQIMLNESGHFVSDRDARARGIGTEDDYTDGNAEVIITSDGVKRCGALLLKHDLAVRIKRTVLFQRRFLADQVYARAQLVEIRAFEKKLNSEINGKDVMLLYAESAEDSKSLQNDLYVLRGLKNIWDSQKQCFETMEKYGMADLQEEYQGIMEYLEYAFVDAFMIDPLEYTELRTIQKPTLEEEFKKMSGGTYREVPPEPDLTPSPEEDAEWERQRAIRQAKHAEEVELLFSWRYAKRDRETARIQFETKDGIRKQVWDKHIESKNNGKASGVSEDDLELLWEPVMQEAKQVLAKAEEVLAEATAAAAEAGVVTDDDPRSHQRFL